MAAGGRRVRLVSLDFCHARRSWLAPTPTRATNVRVITLAIVKHIALSVLGTGKAKDSLRMRRKVAAWDENTLSA